MNAKSSIAIVLSLGLAGGACTETPETTPGPPGGLVIANATLIDGTGNPPKVGASLLIRDDRIELIATDLEAPEGAEVIDASGKFVIPGLIDTHIHLEAPMVFQITEEEKARVMVHTRKALLYNGVTTVLNFARDVDAIFEQREAQREGRLLAPRIYTTGRSFTPQDGWGSRHGGALKDADAARQRALQDAARGVDGFKVVIEDGLGQSGTYEVISDEMLEAIKEVAETEDVPIYVHAINLDEFHKAVDFGARAIVHGLEDPIPEDDTILTELVENGVAVVPTLSLFESFLRYDELPGGFDHPVLKESLPTFLWERMRDPDFMKEENRRFEEVARMDVYDWVKKALPHFRENIAKMQAAGVTLGTGTDAGGPVGYNVQGYNTPWELKLFVEECGLSPMQALVAATRNGAEILGIENDLGTLEPGKWADLLILDADPLQDMSNVRRIETIVQAGRAYPRSDFAYGNPTSSAVQTVQ